MISHFSKQFCKRKGKASQPSRRQMLALSIILIFAFCLSSIPLVVVRASPGISSHGFATGDAHLHAAAQRHARRDGRKDASYVSHSWPPAGQHPDLIRILTVLQHPYDAVVAAPLFRLMSAHPRQLYGAAIVVESPGNNISIKSALKDLRIRDYVAINMDYIKYDTSVQAEVMHHLYHHFLAMTALPDAVVVVGNSVSALSGAIVAQTLDIPVFYITHPAPPPSLWATADSEPGQSINAYDAETYHRAILPYARIVFCATLVCADSVLAGGVRQASRVVVAGSSLLDFLGSMSFSPKQLAAAQRLLTHTDPSSSLSSSSKSTAMPPSNYIAIACSQSCSDVAVRTRSAENQFLNAILTLTERHSDRTFVLFLDAFYNAHPGHVEDPKVSSKSRETIQSFLTSRRPNVIVVGYLSDYAVYAKLLLAADTIVAESDFADGYLEVESVFMNIPVVLVSGASWRPDAISSPARLERVHYDAARITDAVTACMQAPRLPALSSPIAGAFGDGLAAQRILWHISTALNPELQHDCCDSLASIDLRHGVPVAGHSDEQDLDDAVRPPSVSVFLQASSATMLDGVLQRQFRSILSQSEASAIRHIVVLFDSAALLNELKSSTVDASICVASEGTGSGIECSDAARSVRVKVTGVVTHGASLFLAPTIASYATEGIDFVLFVSSDWIPDHSFLSRALVLSRSHGAAVGPIGLTLARNATYVFADPITGDLAPHGGVMELEVDFLSHGWFVQTPWLPEVALAVWRARLEATAVPNDQQSFFIVSAHLWLRFGVRSIAVLSEADHFVFPPHMAGNVAHATLSKDGETPIATFGSSRGRDLISLLAARSALSHPSGLIERRWIQSLGFVPCGLRQLRSRFSGLKCCARLSHGDTKTGAFCTDAYRSLFSGANSLAGVVAPEDFLLPRNRA